MPKISDILEKAYLEFDDIAALLKTDDAAEMQLIFDKALKTKSEIIGRKVYLRGLIEMSNICRKDCLYCGIRKSNANVVRYTLTHDEIMQSVDYAARCGFGSIVMQSGELLGNDFVCRTERLVDEIHRHYPEMLITMSCGEESLQTYQRWFAAGARRYLLRIESSNREIYGKIHPNDSFHIFENRLQALNDLRETGYQVGTGVMIGLPGQTEEDMANDLLFFRNLDVDMIGMGPYIEHSETPLFKKQSQLWPLGKRFQKSLMMIAVLRIMMPTINIAASTALESLDPKGRQKGLLAGANVVMPNVTPLSKKVNYKLYENKAGLYLNPSVAYQAICESIEACGEMVCVNNPGIPKHFEDRTINQNHLI